MALDQNNVTLAALIAIPVVVAMVDVLAAEIFTLFVVFAVGALLWAYTPLGAYVKSLSMVQKYSEKSHEKKE